MTSAWPESFQFNHEMIKQILKKLCSLPENLSVSDSGTGLNFEYFVLRDLTIDCWQEHEELQSSEYHRIMWITTDIICI